MRAIVIEVIEKCPGRVPAGFVKNSYIMNSPVSREFERMRGASANRLREKHSRV